MNDLSLVNHPAICVAAGDSKQAALFYDFVIPEFSGHVLAKTVPDAVEMIVRNPSILPVQFAHDQMGFAKAFDDLSKMVTINASYLYEVWGDREFSRRTRERYDRLKSSLSLPVELVLHPCLPAMMRQSERPRSPSPLAVVVGLKLIDTEQASWDQIFELRKDRQSHTKLRRLRTVLQDNMLGKSKSYIEDKVSLALHDYDETVARWGFATGISNLVSIMTHSSIPASWVGLSTAVTTGSPVGGVVAALTVEVAGTLVSLGKQVSDFKYSLETHPYAFICDTNTKFSYGERV